MCIRLCVDSICTVRPTYFCDKHMCGTIVNEEIPVPEDIRRDFVEVRYILFICKSDEGTTLPCR